MGENDESLQPAKNHISRIRRGILRTGRIAFLGLQPTVQNTGGMTAGVSTTTTNYIEEIAVSASQYCAPGNSLFLGPASTVQNISMLLTAKLR